MKKWRYIVLIILTMLLSLAIASCGKKEQKTVLEQPTNLAITANDAFKAVCKYWDRVTRPEILMTACINAMRVLADPADTGAVCIALPEGM